MKSERWITIGNVRWPWFVFEMSNGSPDGYLVTWQGRVGPFQPYQFRRADYLCGAIERRLHIAGLQWVAMATEVKRTGLYGDRVLRVLVRRAESGDGS